MAEKIRASNCFRCSNKDFCHRAGVMPDKKLEKYVKCIRADERQKTFSAVEAILKKNEWAYGINKAALRQIKALKKEKMRSPSQRR